MQSLESIQYKLYMQCTINKYDLVCCCWYAASLPLVRDVNSTRARAHRLICQTCHNSNVCVCVCQHALGARALLEHMPRDL